MTPDAEYLNDLLVEAYSSILKIEEQNVAKATSLNLSISEIHLIEAIEKNTQEDNKGKTISELSEILKITLPSVTLAINKLVKKGYVTKTRSEEDGRVIFVNLTDRGKKVARVHRHFHRCMVEAVVKDLSDEEFRAMVSGLVKLNKFLNEKIQREE
ncbi:MAG TPA: MarR family transcriptional regulator [Clostridiales bacterium]|nr:MarR family transcriptional regulator [Clostridiales bacterium]